MPRSSPSTDGELLEVELEPLSSAPLVREPEPRTFRLRPGYLIVIGSALIFGLMMVPAAEDRTATLVSVETLPEPAVATTAPALPALSQATLTEESFALLPVAWPEDITGVFGPAFLQDTIWLITSSASNQILTVVRSEDGADWNEVGHITSNTGAITIHDLTAFGGSLVALGTITDQSGPAAAYGYPDQVVLWRSSDGARWDETVIVPSDGQNWHPQLTLVTDDRALLIGGNKVAAGGQILDGIIPPELVPAISEGRLDVTLNSGSPSTVSIMAPPGIEVFRSDAVVVIPTEVRSVLYYSGDSRQWEEVEVGPSLIWSELVPRPGRGFLTRSSEGEMYSTIDGLGWGRNRTIPPAVYARWGEWLVGVQVLPWEDRLLIGAGTDYAGIEAADDVPIWNDTGEVAGGPAGLVSVVPTYLGPPPTVSIISGSQHFTLASDRFSISSEGSDAASVFFQKLPGSYDPATDEVTIDLSDAGDHVVVNLTDLQGLRDRVGGVWETNVFASIDALSWRQADVSLESPFVEILGPVPDGFLIAARPSYDSGAVVEVYRTGPLLTETNG